MWAGDVYSTKHDVVSIVETENKKTNFPVVVNDITIHYAQKTFDVKRYKNTNKFKKINLWIQYFENK